MFTTNNLIAAIIYLLLVPCIASGAYQENFIIASGSKGGNYFATACLLAQKLNNIDKQFHFSVVTTKGSIDNIHKLKSRFADFAIVQRDVLLNNLYSDKDGVKNLIVLFPLFDEKFIIYVQAQHPIPFEEFRQKLEGKKFQIGVTSTESTSCKTFLTIAQLLGLNLSNIKFIEGTYDALIEKIKQGNLDAFVIFSLPLKKLTHQKNISFVYFNNQQIRLLQSRLRNLSISIIGNSDQKTLGIISLFLGIEHSVKKIGENRIIKALSNLSQEKCFISNEIGKTITQFKYNNFIYLSSLSDLPVSTHLMYFLGIKQYKYTIIISVLLTVIAFGLVLYAFYRYINYNLAYLWIRYKHILLEILIICLLYLICIDTIIYAENKLYLTSGIKSSLLDMSYKDLHLWNIIRIFGGDDGGIFPISLLGKIMTVISSYVLIIGTVIVAIIEISLYKLINKRKRGLMKIKYKDHIVIIGWNDSIVELINELLMASKDFYNTKIKIVCIVPNPLDILETNEELNFLEQTRKISFIDGAILNQEILEKANIHQAKTILLLSDNNGNEADERTLLRALAVNKFLKDQSKKIKKNTIKSKLDKNGQFFETNDYVNLAYVIAEINNDEFVTHLVNAGVNGILNKARMRNGILVQSALSHGISKILNNLLSFSTTSNEFYMIDLLKEENRHLRGKTFDELILPLRRQRILLVSIKIIFRDLTGKEIVDEEEIARLLKQEGLSRQIITNPIDDVESTRKTDSDDQLIVLATCYDVIKRGVPKVTFD